MSSANLSSEQMNFYFIKLLHHRLLDAEDSEDNPVYRTTQKGVGFLHCCAQIKSLIAPIVKVRTQGEMLFL